MNLGDVYLELNRVDSALIMEKNAEKIFKNTGAKKYLAVVYLHLATIYSKKGDKILELQYYRKALTSSLGQNNLAAFSSSCYYLANYYLALKQPDSSLYYSKKTLELDRALRYKNVGNAYKILYKSYELKNNKDSAYKYLGLAFAAHDSADTETLASLTNFQKLSFNNQLRLNDLEKEKELIQTKIRTYVLLAVVVVFILLTIIFYRNYRQKRKANHLLHEQKEEIEAQRDELGRAFEELKVTQNQLVQREKMASLGELTAGIAHEIQNPLNFVNNFSEVSAELLEEMDAELNKGDIAEAKAIGADLKQNIEKINHHGKRADFIVKGMLEHSRTSKSEKQLTDLNVLCDEFLKLSYHGLRAKDKSFNAELVTHFEENLPKANVSQQDMGRVMVNLFNNAFYAVRQKVKTAGDGYKPEVTVTTSKNNGELLISVKDNGNGIPDAIKDKIMQPFFTTKPTGEGTGLGLSLSYDIVVKGHGGSISVESKQGDGSEFVVSLPI
jgi:signal transduction histidine kinase